MFDLLRRGSADLIRGSRLHVTRPLRLDIACPMPPAERAVPRPTGYLLDEHRAAAAARSRSRGAPSVSFAEVPIANGWRRAARPTPAPSRCRDVAEAGGRVEDLRQQHSAGQQIDPVERAEERLCSNADEHHGHAGDARGNPGTAAEDRDRTR